MLTLLQEIDLVERVDTKERSGMPQKDSTGLSEEHECQTRGSGFGVRRTPKQAQGGLPVNGAKH